MNMKRILPLLLTLVLGACSTQQQQKIQVPDTPVATTQTSQKTDKKIAVSTSAKPFVPALPGIRVSSVSVPGNYVAITFDDGPSPALTPKVLDILKRHGAAATVFGLGDNASPHASILARASGEGHEIGNHTFSHINMKTTAREQVCSEISRTNSIIQAATGKRVRVMRPPYGSTNAELVNLMFNQYNLRSILWNVDTKDWQHPGVNVVVQRAVGSAKPGSIILLHDIHSSTLAAVEGIVTGLQARGFKLVTVSQLIEIGRRAATQSAETPPAAVSDAQTPQSQQNGHVLLGAQDVQY